MGDQVWLMTSRQTLPDLRRNTRDMLVGRVLCSSAREVATFEGGGEGGEGGGLSGAE